MEENATTMTATQTAGKGKSKGKSHSPAVNAPSSAHARGFPRERSLDAAVLVKETSV